LRYGVAVGRHVLIRTEAGESVVEESNLPAEKNLHDVLTAHPELIPAEDLEMGTTAVVGRESGVESGYADLVLLDRAAQLCLVEVKKEGNPDTRRVVAQLLDYAAALWRMSADDFLQGVLRPYLRSTGVADGDLPDLATFAAQQFGADSAGAEDGSDAAFDNFARRLEETLSIGRFRLVLAAPTIPPGVQQVMEYMNSQGLLLHGLEVSYFGGPAECFVPRLVVRPTVSETKKLAGGAVPLEEEDFLQATPERVRSALAGFLRDCVRVGAKVTWNSYGPSIRITAPQERVVAWLEKKRLNVVVKPPAGYPAAPFAKAKADAAKFQAGSVSKDEWNWSGRYEDLTDDDLEKVLQFALVLARDLAPRVEFTTLPFPLQTTFQRNDNNIWQKTVPSLAGKEGLWLRGTLTRVSTGATASVSLEPLAGGSSGWRPRIEAGSKLEELWPPSDLTGAYALNVTEAGQLASAPPPAEGASQQAT
jgi:hypothetical protein